MPTNVNTLEYCTCGADNRSRFTRNLRRAFGGALVALMMTGVASALPIVGAYDPSLFNGPEGVIDREEDLRIERDGKTSKKIWITGLIAGQRICGILDTRTEDALIYSIPKQTAGDYSIELGCVMYDMEEQQIIISLNNRTDCAGIGQTDLDQGVSIGKDGVAAAGVKIGRDGVSAAGVDVGKDGVRVNTKEMLKGVYFMGTKQEDEKKDDE